MLESQKEAPLAFALKTLHFFRNHKPWVSEEIPVLLKKNGPIAAQDLGL
jgi:hypothetical protein